MGMHQGQLIQSMLYILYCFIVRQARAEQNTFIKRKGNVLNVGPFSINK